jgi:hypothetical protein
MAKCRLSAQRSRTINCRDRQAEATSCLEGMGKAVGPRKSILMRSILTLLPLSQRVRQRAQASMARQPERRPIRIARP